MQVAPGREQRWREGGWGEGRSVRTEAGTSGAMIEKYYGKVRDEIAQKALAELTL